MRSLLDLGGSDAWTFAWVDHHIVVIKPTRTVAGIPKERVSFRIERDGLFEGVNPNLRYVFQGLFSLGEGCDFAGEYTLRLEIDALNSKKPCSITSVAEITLSEFELRLAISIAQSLSETLPRNLIVDYEALHEAEWIADTWDAVTVESLRF